MTGVPGTRYLIRVPACIIDHATRAGSGSSRSPSPPWPHHAGRGAPRRSCSTDRQLASYVRQGNLGTETWGRYPCFSLAWGGRGEFRGRAT